MEHNLVGHIILTPTHQSIFHWTLAGNKEWELHVRLILKYWLVQRSGIELGATFVPQVDIQSTETRGKYSETVRSLKRKAFLIKQKHFFFNYYILNLNVFINVLPISYRKCHLAALNYNQCWKHYEKTCCSILRFR